LGCEASGFSLVDRREDFDAGNELVARRITNLDVYVPDLDGIQGGNRQRSFDRAHGAHIRRRPLCPRELAGTPGCREDLDIGIQDPNLEFW